MKNKKYKDIVTLLCVILGSLLSAINIKSFVNTGGLFPGGVTGITVFIQRFCSTYLNFSISYAIVNFSLNAIPAYIGYKTIGKKFTIYSCIMILLTGIFVEVIPVAPVTGDRLLIAVFGGIINGVSLGIALRGNASSGGTDFIAMYISNKTNASSWNYVLGMNAIMLIIAGFLFGWEAALYSIIYQFCSTQVIRGLHTRYKRMTLFIITSKPEEVSKALLEHTHHGITRFEGVGSYSGKPRTMLYTVITAAEVKMAINDIRSLDEASFINVTKTEQIDGKFYLEPIQ